MSISIDHIRQLPVDQQLRLAAEMWVNLLATGQQVQQWQIEEVGTRVRDLDDNPAILPHGNLRPIFLQIQSFGTRVME